MVGRDFHELPGLHRLSWLSRPGARIRGQFASKAVHKLAGRWGVPPHPPDPIAPLRGELLKRQHSVSWQGTLGLRPTLLYCSCEEAPQSVRGVGVEWGMGVGGGGGGRGGAITARR